MTKLLKRMITMLLVVTCLVGTVAGCSNSSNNDNETKEAVTTKKAEVTTTEAKAELDTEGPTTEYVYKGGSFSIGEQYANYFYDLVVENGTVINMNEIVPDDKIACRGNCAYILLDIFKMDTTKFEEKYLFPGSQYPKVTYEDNYCIQYNGDKKYVFKFVRKDEEYDVIYFDVYTE